ncbi:MAG: hypothetical protein JOZ77_12795 [Candidatus Eremiobacteraeota bacterium]|nr:hypothetical protein [Candidatus Eremiobacteraeota bacterium]
MDNTTKLRGLDFFMFLVDDMKRARSFYEGLFSLSAGSADSEYFVEYDLPDGTTFALARDPNAQREPSGGAVFGVANIDTAIARAEELGGKLLRRYGGEQCAAGWCMDPEGNPFGVHERK